MGYEQLSVDGDLATQVRLLFERHPGLWSSRRALYHELLRRGLMSIEAAPVIVPSPPPAPASPSAGPPEEAVAEATPTPPRRAGGRSPRRREAKDVTELESEAAIAEAVHPITSPPASESEVSTDQFAASAATASAPEPAAEIRRREGRARVDGRESGAEVRGPDAAASETTHRAAEATASPAASPIERTHPKKELLLTRMKAFARDAGKSRDPLAYFVAIVQKAYADGGHVEPSDEEARELVKALAAQEPAIEHVLEKVVA